MSCQGIWRTAGSDSAGPRLGRRIRRLIKLPGDANPLKFGPVRSEPPGQWFSASAVHENHLESLGGKMLMHTAPPPSPSPMHSLPLEVGSGPGGAGAAKGENCRCGGKAWDPRNRVLGGPTTCSLLASPPALHRVRKKRMGEVPSGAACCRPERLLWNKVTWSPWWMESTFQ